MKSAEKKKVEFTKEKEPSFASEKHLKIQSQKESILEKLKEKGFRITKQRMAVLDIILENECSSCKEIFYKTVKINKKIGAATIYRTMNMLEEIGVLDRKKLYMISPLDEKQKAEESQPDIFVIAFEDGTNRHLNQQQWEEVLQAGMCACGYLDHGKIISVNLKGEKRNLN